jgi:hypothetical protein
MKPPSNKRQRGRNRNKIGNIKSEEQAENQDEEMTSKKTVECTEERNTKNEQQMFLLKLLSPTNAHFI